jgi:hypothetical protein
VILLLSTGPGLIALPVREVERNGDRSGSISADVGEDIVVGRLDDLEATGSVTLGDALSSQSVESTKVCPEIPGELGRSQHDRIARLSRAVVREFLKQDGPVRPA